MLQYPIKAMKVGEVLDVAIKLTRDNFTSLFLLTCFLALPFHLVQNTISHFAEEQTEDAEDVTTVLLNKKPATGLALVDKLLGIADRLVVEPLTTGALIFMVSAIYLGKPVKPGAALGQASQQWGSLLGAGIIYGLIVVAGLLLLIVPGIYWSLKYGLYAQLIMIERCNASNFTQRSAELMKGNMGDSLMLGFLYLCIVIGLIVGVAFIPFAPISIVLTSVIETAAEIFAATIFVVFYYSCRCKNENFDLTVLAREAAADDVPPPEPLAQ